MVLAYVSALKKFLLYVRRSEIRGVDIDNPYMNVMTALTVPDIDDVTVVDYDALEERLYWADVKTQTIRRAFINGTGLQTVITGGESTFCTGTLFGICLSIDFFVHKLISFVLFFFQFEFCLMQCIWTKISSLFFRLLTLSLKLCFFFFNNKKIMFTEGLREKMTVQEVCRRT